MQMFDFLKNINTNDTFGYKERSPYPSEMNYFKQNPLVGGMATEDNKIILNPYSGLTRQQNNAIKQNETLIALEVGGRELSTEKLAETMQQWMLEGNDIVLAIGGPDGLSDAVRKAAAWHWSLSKLTMPHPLVRILLIEQLYRAMSINHNHPYHRA